MEQYTSKKFSLEAVCNQVLCSVCSLSSSSSYFPLSRLLEHLSSSISSFSFIFFFFLLFFLLFNISLTNLVTSVSLKVFGYFIKGPNLGLFFTEMFP